MRIYLNGEQQGAPVKHTSTRHAAGPVLIGLAGSAGTVYDARLHQGALTLSEIEMLAMGD